MRVAPITQVSIVNINLRQPQIIQPKKKLKTYGLRIGVLLSFLGNLIITYYVMFQKNIKLTQKYFIYITPSSLFFKIWPIIYTTIFFCIIHNTFKNIWQTKSSLILIGSNCLLMICSAIWQIRNVASIVVGGFVLAGVDNSTIYFWRVLLDQHLAPDTQIQNQVQNITQNSIQNPSNQIVERQRICRPKYTQFQLLVVRNVFAFYIGWVSVTGTVIVGITCVYWWGFSLCEQFIIFWISTPLFALAIYLFMATKVQGYIVSVIWGFIGAGLASVNNINKQGYC